MLILNVNNIIIFLFTLSKSTWHCLLMIMRFHSQLKWKTFPIRVTIATDRPAGPLRLAVAVRPILCYGDPASLAGPAGQISSLAI